MLISLLKALLLFGLVGPMVGLCCIVAQDPSGFSTVLPSILVTTSFAFGVVPAVLTGLAAWTFRYKLPRYLGGLTCGVIGALASALFLVLLPIGMSSWESLVRLGVLPGGIAGFVCGLLYFWPPNSSFKPNALRSTNHMAD